MEGLPKLPGFDYESRKFKMKHHVPHSFDYINGYAMPRAPSAGIGGEPLKEDSIQFMKVTDPILYDPILTYGRMKKPDVEPFKPHHVIYDKKTLKFNAFFRQFIPESEKERYRTRFVEIFYFLEDDTITVLEPFIDNCGFPQGKLVRRGKITKNSAGQYYNWKDFNLGIDMEFQGIVFHITNCDPYTTDFLLSNGIELNEPECSPIDPVLNERMITRLRTPLTRKTPPIDDKLRRYLEFQGKVLHFDCVLDETDRPGGELLTYKLFYYLEDDTIAIKELKENQEGRDRFPMMLRRVKLPKNWKQVPVDYPSIVMERSDREVNEYYQPKDLVVGETIFVYGRRFLLLNCDRFTRIYYEQVLKTPQPQPLQIKQPEAKKCVRQLPDYLGFGTPEDSIASFKRLIPKSPKKDIINYLVNANKTLRYGCILDSAHPEDKERRFILIYRLADQTIQIIELPVDNSGILGGRFLSARKLIKPDSDPRDPIYYSPRDFYIGTTVHVFSHRFKITSADLYVYRWMQNHPEQFTAEVMESVRNYLLLQGHLREDLSKALDEELMRYDPQPVEDEPQDAREALQNLKVDDGGSLIPGASVKETPAAILDEDDRNVCPYFLIPESERRKQYHENEAQQEQIQTGKKSVHFAE